MIMAEAGVRYSKPNHYEKTFNFVLKFLTVDPILQTGAALLGLATRSSQRIAGMTRSTAPRIRSLFFPLLASPKAGFLRHKGTIACTISRNPRMFNLSHADFQCLLARSVLENLFGRPVLQLSTPLLRRHIILPHFFHFAAIMR